VHSGTLAQATEATPVGGTSSALGNVDSRSEAVNHSHAGDGLPRCPGSLWSIDRRVLVAGRLATHEGRRLARARPDAYRSRVVWMYRQRVRRGLGRRLVNVTFVGADLRLDDARTVARAANCADANRWSCRAL